MSGERQIESLGKTICKSASGRNGELSAEMFTEILKAFHYLGVFAWVEKLNRPIAVPWLDGKTLPLEFGLFIEWTTFL